MKECPKLFPHSVVKSNLLYNILEEYSCERGCYRVLNINANYVILEAAILEKYFLSKKCDCIRLKMNSNILEFVFIIKQY